MTVSDKEPILKVRDLSVEFTIGSNGLFGGKKILRAVVGGDQHFGAAAADGLRSAADGGALLPLHIHFDIAYGAAPKQMIHGFAPHHRFLAAPGIAAALAGREGHLPHRIGYAHIVTFTVSQLRRIFPQAAEVPSVRLHAEDGLIAFHPMRKLFCMASLWVPRQF